MIIALLAGRKFSSQVAQKWFAAHGQKFMGRNHLWRLGATQGAEEDILEMLINRGEHIQIFLPYTVDFHQQSSRQLITRLKRAGQVEECRIKDHGYGSGFVKRNMIMMNGAKLFICFYENHEGALKKTIEKTARFKNKKILIISQSKDQESFKYLKIKDL